MKFPDFKTIAA